MGGWLWPLLWGFQMELAWGTGIFQPQKSPPPKARTPKAKEWASPSSSTSSWGPTPDLDKVDPEGSEAALTFLYSGDVGRLSQANCSRRFEAPAPGGAAGPPPSLRATLRGATEALSHATNFLNMLFQTNDIRESSVKEDTEWYHALVRSLVEGDPQVYRAVLTFHAHPASAKPQLVLQASKENNEILLQELSAEGPRNGSGEGQGFPGPLAPPGLSLRKRVLVNDLKSLHTPKWHRGDSYVMDASHVRWSPPFLECQDSKFLPSWMVALSSAFYGLKPDLSPEFKGVVRMDVKLQDVEINPCASSPGWFTATHQCDLNSTQCVPQESRGFVLGRYLCLCRPGFYGANRAAGAGQPGPEGSSARDAGQDGAATAGSLLACRPCREGCVTCVDDSPCLIQEDWPLRAAVLAFQAFCMLAVFLSMLVSYHFRKSKRIRASGVILLETILFGSLLLYFPVFILYFKPSIFRCIVLRWVRMLGFAIVYGTITLKLYRVLKVFLSRSAQRMPYMSSGRVLRMLGLILLLVLWFLAAWTVGMLENIDKNIPLVIRSRTATGLQFYICDHDRWDYMMVVAEMLFLLWGSFLCYATRTVPSAFHEPRYMGIALHNEMIISAAFHVVRFLMVPSLHPDWTLLLFFVHTHGTITLTLALLFVPKFLHAGAPLREEIAAEVYEDELDMRRSGSYLNNSIASAWSEHSLDPDDIRDELKKLYTQLEVHKTKKMTANNPHLQKKRSSKRGLGRSIMRRLTEIPESVSRQCSRDDKEGAGGSGGGSHSGSYKRRLLDSSSSSVKVKEDASKHKAFSLRKSHSTYDHMREPKEGALPSRHDSLGKEPPLLDSLMRKKLAKKASERANSESLDSAPLVYKSASAHNLLADKKPLHPKPSPLQKSLSVLMSAREKALLLTSRAYLEDSCQAPGENEREVKPEASAPETPPSRHPEGGEPAEQALEAAKQPQSDDAPQGTESSLRQDSSDRAAVCPWEGDATPQDKAQKHVTYAPIKSISVDSSQLAGRAPLAGKRTPPQPPVRYQSLAHSLERSEQTRPATDTPRQGSKDNTARINICPWEVEELPGTTEEAERGDENVQPPSAAGHGRLLPAPSFAAEICPWELAEEEVLKPSQQEKPSEPGGTEKPPGSLAKPLSLQTPPQKSSIRSIGLAMKAFHRVREKGSVTRKEDEASQRKKDKDAGSQCDTPKLAETSAPSVGRAAKRETTARGPEESRPKIISKQATICPWEEETTSPAQQNNTTSKVLEICPWEARGEAADDPPDGLAPAEAGSAVEKKGSKGTGNAIRRKLERMRSQWESVCPWENTETEAPSAEADAKPASPPKGAAKKADSVESRRAEVCPWQTEEADANVNAEAGSWEVAETPPGKRMRQGLSQEAKSSALKAATGPSKTADTVNRQREATCPWESVDTEEAAVKADRKSFDLTKKSGSVESKRVAVCPWESEEGEASVSPAVCPWDVSPAPSDKGKLKQERDAVSKGAASLSPKATASASKSLEKGSCPREAICPWESMDMEEALGETNRKSCDLSISPSRKSGSVESKKAEVCPWEMEEVETSVRPEICPWEAADAPSEKGTLLRKAGVASTKEQSSKSKATGPSKALEPGSSHKGPLYSWETVDVQEPSLKPASKRFQLPNVASKKSDSAEDKKAEVCPWESADVEAHVKTEICPWEEAAIPSEKGAQDKVGDHGVALKAAAGSSKQLEKGRSQTEAICPREGRSMEESSVKADRKSFELSKGPSKESKKAEVCPWESEEVEASIKAEICPWEVLEAPSDKGKLRQDAGESDKKGLRGMGDIPAKKLEKESSQRESVCPWEDFSVTDTGNISSRKSDSVESKKSDICPWEGLDPRAVEKESATAERCPWDVEGAMPHKTGKHAAETASTAVAETPMAQQKKAKSKHAGQAEHKPLHRLGPDAKPPKGLSLGSSTMAEVLSWEVGVAPILGRCLSKGGSVMADICPWEVEGAPAGDRETSQTSEGCPLEAGAVSLVCATPAKSKPAETREEEAGGPSPTKSDICPWDCE
ncbi:putative G-protein coupled receptor 179 [Pelodiscus sinensis]|uniref:putative G-protein coupled receptor 179 n=1 Tax=Pelodiscus sinensis TaxID=13735 RepID=UPI003F6B06C5